MKESLFVFLFAFLSCGLAKYAEPRVQIYTRLPEEYGKANVLICHVTSFHPPLIGIELLNNGKEIPGSNQTDLAFEDNWNYHLTKYVPITLTQKDKLECKVTHMGKSTRHILDVDM